MTFTAAEEQELKDSVTETRDLARETNQRMKEVVIPALRGDENNPGLLSRMDKAEKSLLKSQAVMWTLAKIGGALVMLLSVGVAFANHLPH